jgi:hypothetical protein
MPYRLLDLPHFPCYENHLAKLPPTGCAFKAGEENSCIGYLDHPFKNKLFETEKEILSLLANTGRSVENQTSSTASSCLNNDRFMSWRSFFYDRCFDLSPAAEGLLLACPLLSLSSLDQTAHFLLAALHPHRSWPKQVRAHRRKCPLAKASHHPQAPGETASLHEKRSPAPRSLGTNGSELETNAAHRPARDMTARAAGALSSGLQAHVTNGFSYAEGRPTNHRVDEANGEGQSALGS